MPLSEADFYAYSRATGTPVPRDAQERAEIAPQVLGFRQGQLSATKEELDRGNFIDMAGKTALVAGLGAGAAALATGGRFGKLRDALANVIRPKDKGATTGVRTVDLNKTNIPVEEVYVQDVTPSAPTAKTGSFGDIYQDLSSTIEVSPSTLALPEETAVGRKQRIIQEVLRRNPRGAGTSADAQFTPKSVDVDISARTEREEPLPEYLARARETSPERFKELDILQGNMDMADLFYRTKGTGKDVPALPAAMTPRSYVESTGAVAPSSSSPASRRARNQQKDLDRIRSSMSDVVDSVMDEDYFNTEPPSSLLNLANKIQNPDIPLTTETVEEFKNWAQKTFANDPTVLSELNEDLSSLPLMRGATAPAPSSALQAEKPQVSSWPEISGKLKQLDASIGGVPETLDGSGISLTFNAGGGKEVNLYSPQSQQILEKVGLTADQVEAGWLSNLKSKGILESSSTSTLVEQQNARRPLVSEQSVEAVDTGADQQTGRVMQSLQRNEDLDLGQIEIMEDMAKQYYLTGRQQPAPQEFADAAINQVAASLPDGLPTDQAEGAWKYTQLASTRSVPARYKYQIQPEYSQGRYDKVTGLEHEKNLRAYMERREREQYAKDYEELLGSRYQGAVPSTAPPDDLDKLEGIHTVSNIKDINPIQEPLEAGAEYLVNLEPLDKAASKTSIRGASKVAREDLAPRPQEQPYIEGRRILEPTEEPNFGSLGGVGVYGLERAYAPGAIKKAGEYGTPEYGTLGYEYSKAAYRKPTDPSYGEPEKKGSKFSALSDQQIQNFVKGATQKGNTRAVAAASKELERRASFDASRELRALQVEANQGNPRAQAQLKSFIQNMRG